VKRLALLALLLASSCVVAAPAPMPKKSAGIAGTWELVKFQYGDGPWAEPAKGERELKQITSTGFTWLVISRDSKEVTRGAGGRSSIDGGSYRETVQYSIGAGQKGSVGREISYTWRTKGEELHTSWTEGDQKGKQVWRLAK
jgi:hypothetical protein